MLNRATIRTFGALAVMAIAIALPSPALAVDWGANVKLSSTMTTDQELVRTGANSAIEVWLRTPPSPLGLIARRTTDGGQTWRPAQTIATNVDLGFGLAAVGQDVDLVYTVRTACPTGGDVGVRIYYRRSADGGATWTAPRALTSACSQVGEPDVARGADGQVTVVWTGLLTGRVLVATSRDGGVTFAPAVQVATTSIRDFDVTSGAGLCCHVAKPAVAIGSRTTYVTYAAATDNLSVRRSADHGLTWSSPSQLSGHALTERASIVASGDRAIVGYTDFATGTMAAMSRTTVNRGSTWSSQREIVRRGDHDFSQQPQFATDGGVLGVIVKFGTPGRSLIWYRQSTDWGSSWGSTIRISPASGFDPESAGVALLGDQVLAGYAENGDTVGLWVRRGAR